MLKRTFLYSNFKFVPPTNSPVPCFYSPFLIERVALVQMMTFYGYKNEPHVEFNKQWQLQQRF